MSFGDFRRELIETALSLAPAIVFMVLAQVIWLRLPWEEFGIVLVGLACTVFGFVLFIQGAKLGLLPLGQGIGTAFIERGAVKPLLVFGFLLGIVLTVAEPDVRLLTFQLDDMFGDTVNRTALIGAAALGLGLFAVMALLRIALAWPIHYVLIPGYGLAMVLALFADELTVTQAFDIGAVTTGPMTVPFLIALGVGIASVLGNQSRMRASFGLMAIGSVGPVLIVLVWGLLRGAS
ncbi:MAG: DUF1538 domain-containing protein [Trueperaceae bacterium]|nr:MAG: DUF1538 domain-containing protein [Trueperaceae bacterium]